jgi:hypothetical protein
MYKWGGQGSHLGLLQKVSISRIANKILGKPKPFQVKEEKVLTEDTVSMMVQIMSLNGKDIGGGMECPIRSSQ